MRTIIFSLVILFTYLQAFGQVNTDQYPERNSELIHQIESLKYDSVKVYSFDCGPVVHPKGYVFMTFDGKVPPGEPLIDSAQHWNARLSDSGKTVKKVDVHYIKFIFERSHTDLYRNRVRSCYNPRMGIAFFKGGIVTAHIDVCLECKQAFFEEFDKGRVSYSYKWEELGKRMLILFKSICLKYELHCCDTF